MTRMMPTRRRVTNRRLTRRRVSHRTRVMRVMRVMRVITRMMRDVWGLLKWRLTTVFRGAPQINMLLKLLFRLTVKVSFPLTLPKFKCFVII